MPDPRRPEYLGEPTLAQVMRRPVWILALLLAMAVAAGFAWLGQWQMGIAVQNAETEKVDTESVRELTDVAELGKGVTDAAAGIVVETSGSLVPGDSGIVEPRQNGGETGAWVVGRLAVDNAGEPASLAVAIGWAPSVAEAERALKLLEAEPDFAEPRSFAGRYMPPEAPDIPRAAEDPLAMHSMVPAYLANVWDDVDGAVYSGYLVLHPESGTTEPLILGAELGAIDSVPPLPVEKVNWLNVFYAIEWVVFAGFALFFWFRLTRDAWEKEHEMQALIAAGERAAGEDSDPDPNSEPTQSPSARDATE